MRNAFSSRSRNQLALDFQRGPGRPSMKTQCRRRAKSVTLAPDLISRFDSWAYQNGLNFSRGVEAAIIAFMQRSDSNVDV